MPPVTRVGDLCTGHDDCPAVPAIEGDSSFLVDGKPIVLVGDKYASHGCDKHEPHQGYLAGGAPGFFVNGRAVGRVGDPISCGGTVAEGASFFTIGNGCEKAVNKSSCERYETTTSYTRREGDEIFFCLPRIADAMGNKANEQDRQGWHYLRDMFYKWLGGQANSDASQNPKPFWVDIDWVLSYDNMDVIFNAILPNEAVNYDARLSLNNVLQKQGYFTQENKDFDFINSEWQNWQAYYYQYYPINYMQAGLGTGLYASLGTFTFRILPKGTVEYLGDNQYKITIGQIAGFVHDIFNFEGEQDLGFWSCQEKDVSSFSKDSYIGMNNQKFRNFREHNKLGNDFIVLSEPKIIDNFNVYSYNYVYE